MTLKLHTILEEQLNLIPNMVTECLFSLVELLGKWEVQSVPQTTISLGVKLVLTVTKDIPLDLLIQQI